MNFIEYPDRAALFAGLAQQFERILRTALADSARVSMAVAGGTTPAPIFDLLAQATLDWDRVNLMATDERWVPQDHERSNARMIRERFLVNRAETATFVPFFRDGLSAEQGAATVSAEVQALAPLTLVLLGMGEDMHTASLFPDTDGLDAGLSAAADPLVVLRPESQPDARISLSAPILNSAAEKHLAIFGDGKRQALERAQQLPPTKAPIAAVLPQLHVHWAP